MPPADADAEMRESARKDVGPVALRPHPAPDDGGRRAVALGDVLAHPAISAQPVEGSLVVETPALANLFRALVCLGLATLRKREGLKPHLLALRVDEGQHLLGG